MRLNQRVNVGFIGLGVYLLSVLQITTASTALADEKKIRVLKGFIGRSNDYDRGTKIEFEYDDKVRHDGKGELTTERGRAWVRASMEQWDSEQNSMYKTFRARVPGLYLDKTRASIVYRHGGKETVCATLVRRKRFRSRWTEVRNTGNCTFEHNVTKQWVDDSFSGYNAYFLDVHMIVR